MENNNEKKTSRASQTREKKQLRKKSGLHHQH